MERINSYTGSSEGDDPREQAEAESEKNAGNNDEDEIVLRFLDSTDEYLVLINSLSSILQEGWLELASARHSMGTSRVSSALYDLKVQSASTTLKVEGSSEISQSEPHFILDKWSSLEEAPHLFEEVKSKEAEERSNSTQLRHRSSSNTSDKDQEKCSSINDSALSVDSKVQRGRAKSLTVFGALVSPKLRSAQMSFEKALSTIVEIANVQSLMLSAYGEFGSLLSTLKCSTVHKVIGNLVPTAGAFDSIFKAEVSLADCRTN